MKPFTAKLIVSINIDQNSDRSQFEEQIQSVKTESELETFHKLKSLGQKEETHFTNQKI